MKAILGISGYYHDSAAALVVDGRIVAAAQEERFSRIKHDSSFPRMAVDYCLREAGLRPEDLDHVVFYEKPIPPPPPAPGNPPRRRAQGIPGVPDGDAALDP